MKRSTLKDIAQMAGVSVSTVSEALRSPTRSKKVGVETYEKIARVAASVNYQPQAAARALVTGKTQNIGFLVSSKTSLGLANNYFSTIMTGVQACCEERGYHCVIGLSDLSSINDFVMPRKISHKAVDGVVLVGHVDDGVAQKLMDCEMPFIVFEGKPGYSPPGVLSFKCNWGEKWHRIFSYMIELGHRHFGCGGIHNEKAREYLEEVFKNVKQQHPDKALEITIYGCGEEEYDKFDFGSIIAQTWIKSTNRPTAILGYDQFCVGFLGHALRLGIKCPEDVSVLSDCETVLCERFYPRITSVREPVVENAYNATNIFADYLMGDISWIEANRRSEDLWKSGEIVTGESTGPAAVSNP